MTTRPSESHPSRPGHIYQVASPGGIPLRIRRLAGLMIADQTLTEHRAWPVIAVQAKAFIGAQAGGGNCKPWGGRGLARRCGEAWQDASMTSTSPEPESPDDPEDPKEPDDPEDPKEEAKRKFREALERKRAREAGTAPGLGGKPADNVQEGTARPEPGARSAAEAAASQTG